MKRLMTYLLTSIAIALLAGCSTVRMFPSEVKVFSDWPATAATGSTASYSFTRTAEQEGSLEHKSYEAAVREVLASKGFNEVTGTAQYKVALTYGSKQDKTLREVYYEDPFYYGAPFLRPHMGFGYWGRHWGAWGSVPLYTSVRYGAEFPIYNRELKIDISDAATGAKRYEATARNDSRYDGLTLAMPYLARAALDGFPQANGTVRRVDIPVPNEEPKAQAKPAAAPASK